MAARGAYPLYATCMILLIAYACGQRALQADSAEGTANKVSKAANLPALCIEANSEWLCSNFACLHKECVLLL